MRLLLDTHVAIGAITNDRRLTAAARELIQGSTEAPWVSVATIWEIAIKHPLRRGAEPIPFSAVEFGSQGDLWGWRDARLRHGRVRCTSWLSLPSRPDPQAVQRRGVGGIEGDPVRNAGQPDAHSSGVRP